MTQRRRKTKAEISSYLVILVQSDLSCFSRCRSDAPAQLRQLGYMGKPTKECLRVCRAVQFFYPTTLRCHIINNETKSLRQCLQLYLSGMLQVSSNVPEILNHKTMCVFLAAMAECLCKCRTFCSIFEHYRDPYCLVKHFL